MGWTALLDENDQEIGIVGDSVWDIMGEAVDKIIAEYEEEFRRKPTYDELLSIFEFVTGEIQIDSYFH